MFTGLVEAISEVLAASRSGSSIRIEVRRPDLFDDARTGDSISVSGACLTAVEVGATLRFDAVAETLRRTTLGEFRGGSLVNLERSLAVGDRLGGHFVQGHVDGVATLAMVEPDGVYRFRAGAELTAMMIPKGSVTLDGVSLTLVEVAADCFTVSLIPYTLETTTLGRKKIGDRLNVETDILGKWVKKLLGLEGASIGLTEKTLRRFGFA